MTTIISRKLTESEQAEYRAERAAKKEQKRIRDDAQDKASLETFVKYEYTTREEFIPYSLGTSPKNLSYKIENEPGFKKECDSRKAILNHTPRFQPYPYNDNERPYKLEEFVNFCIEKGLTLPPELEALASSQVENPEKQIADLQATLATQISDNASLKKANGDLLVNKQVHDGALKLVASMGMGRYKYDPSKDKNNSTTDISDSLSLLGFSMSDKTILKRLREGYDLVATEDRKALKK